jgi:hypothetical protein
MTIKDIFDTPISELWGIASGFVTGYLIYFSIFFFLVMSFIVYVAFNVFKGHREFGYKANKNKRQ